MKTMRRRRTKSHKGPWIGTVQIHRMYTASVRLNVLCHLGNFVFFLMNFGNKQNSTESYETDPLMLKMF